MSFKKILYKIIIVLVLLILLVAIAFFSLISSSKPINEGEVSISNVLDSVVVIKDQWGIPHIQAENQHDALFAYGFTVAKDRLFQMDLQRRLARGELSEILGKDLIKIDKMLRTYMISHYAEEYISDTNKINSKSLSYVDAFIEGVNYFIKTGPKTIEHRLINAEVREFERLDVASMTIYMAFSFMDGVKRDMLYSMLKEKINSEDLKIIFPDYADNNLLTIQEPLGDSIPRRDYCSSNIKIVDSGYSQLISYFDISNQLINYNPPFHGSNSWVIAPSRTKNGNAILANDPHIGLSKPDVWYEAHISYPGYNNYGYYVPAIPFPLIGHDNFKAWGLTMSENDEVDVYYETFNDKKDSVLQNNKWVAIQEINQTIKVKDSDDVNLSIRITPNGPIISDYVEGYSGKPLAFSWVFYKMENPIFDMYYELTNAKALKAFETSLSKLASPGLNFSYVDVEGNIAWWVAGRFPVRDSSINAKSILDGNNPKHNVISYVEFKDNPHLINPESGVIITANNLPTAKRLGDIPRLDGYFRSADRAHRIHDLISKKEKWSTEELKNIQTDVYLASGVELKDKISSVIKNFNHEFLENEIFALEEFNNWDGNLNVESIGGSVFQMTFYHILKVLMEPTLGSDYFRLYMNNCEHWDFFKNLILKESVPFVHSSSFTFDQLIIKGFKQGVLELENKFGNHLSDWKWGSLHTIEFDHPLGKVKPLNKLFNLGPYSVNAGNNVVNKIMSFPGNHDYKVSSLPSTRRLVEIGNPKNSYSIIPSGNSGNFWSENYDDQVDLFLDGKYREINFSKKQLDQNISQKLLILPN